jgi:hypothetical protein
MKPHSSGTKKLTISRPPPHEKRPPSRSLSEEGRLGRDRVVLAVGACLALGGAHERGWPLAAGAWPEAEAGGAQLVSVGE